MSEKNSAISKTKFFCTLLIVLYHIGYPYDGDEGYRIFMIVKNVATMCVPIFALISGFLL